MELVMHEIVVSDPETGERFRADESVRYFYEVRCGFLVEPPEKSPEPHDIADRERGRQEREPPARIPQAKGEVMDET